MDQQNVILADYEPGQNVVRVSYVGVITPAVAACHVDAIAAALARAPQGFYLLTDLSRLVSMDVACMPFMTKTMETARRGGVGRVVRLIPDPTKDIGLNIMSLFHYPHGLPILTCENEAEVARALG